MEDLDEIRGAGVGDAEIDTDQNCFDLNHWGFEEYRYMQNFKEMRIRILKEIIYAVRNMIEAILESSQLLLVELLNLKEVNVLDSAKMFLEVELLNKAGSGHLKFCNNSKSRETEIITVLQCQNLIHRFEEHTFRNLTETGILFEKKLESQQAEIADVKIVGLYQSEFQFDDFHTPEFKLEISASSESAEMELLNCLLEIEVKALIKISSEIYETVFYALEGSDEDKGDHLAQRNSGNEGRFDEPEYGEVNFQNVATDVALTCLVLHLYNMTISLELSDINTVLISDQKKIRFCWIVQHLKFKLEFSHKSEFWNSAYYVMHVILISEMRMSKVRNLVTETEAAEQKLYSQPKVMVDIVQNSFKQIELHQMSLEIYSSSASPDDASDLLNVRLYGLCYTQYKDELAYFNSEVWGNLSYGMFRKVVEWVQEELILWLLIKGVMVTDPSSGMILFNIWVECKCFAASTFDVPLECLPEVEEATARKGELARLEMKRSC
ncbi:hypothetical protein ZIOFF_065595 [Zingiber officinale]|uniref:Uncharacterized protein n=1 Tax=Zingiber officinale TaxID=94328 RepID=A0A8J5K8Z6_ZINOF|nr:hypothetical protein ZIOFF_065595 [Zingiber officinale]